MVDNFIIATKLATSTWKIQNDNKNAKKAKLDFLQFFCHDFLTKNARWPVKALQTRIIAYFLIKTYDDELAHVVGAQGPVTLAKNAWIYPHYVVTHKKNKFQNFPI